MTPILDGHKHYQGLVDTSRVVAHDISAQLHVLQFCIDELDDHINPKGRRYLENLKDGTKRLGDVVQNYRDYLKLSFNPGQEYTLYEICQHSKCLLANHFSRDFNKLEFDWDHSLKGLSFKSHAVELMHIVYSLFSIIAEQNLHHEELLEKSLKVTVAGEICEDGRLEITIQFNGKTLDYSFFEKEMLEIAPDKGFWRKFLGLQIMRNLMGQDVGQLEVEHKDGLNSIRGCFTIS